MAKVDWLIEGVSFGNCNCDYGCPCQFESLPTHGNCAGFEAFRIDRGHFGEIRLDGLAAALVYAWPGPIFEGKGAIQAIVDARASPEQRDALNTILHGGETAEAATHWWVYATMSDTHHPPLSQPIHFDVDIEARQARVSIPGILEAQGTPIKSPATGQDHRVQIGMPNGIEFELAEIGNASSTITAAISLNLRNSYGQFAVLRHSGDGVVR